MKMDLVNKIREFGSNVKYSVRNNARKYIVMGSVGTLSAVVLFTSGCGLSQEDIARMNRDYHTERLGIEAETKKAEYIDTEVAKIEGIETQVEKNTATLGEVKTQLGDLEITVKEGFEGIPGQLDEALKQYLEVQESERYVPWDGRQYRPWDGRRYTPQHRVGSVDEVRDAVRYYFTKDALKNMDHKSGFTNTFGSVPYEWVDGISSRWNRELEYNNAFYINEKQDLAIFYFRDGRKTSRNVPGYKAEDFVMKQIYNNPWLLGELTIVESGKPGHFRR